MLPCDLQFELRNQNRTPNQFAAFAVCCIQLATMASVDIEEKKPDTGLYASKEASSSRIQGGPGPGMRYSKWAPLGESDYPC